MCTVTRDKHVSAHMSPAEGTTRLQAGALCAVRVPHAGTMETEGEGLSHSSHLAVSSLNNTLF